VFCLQPEHHMCTLTTNRLRRLNKKIKRRTRVATLFPNITSCLQLVSAVLTKQDEESLSNKIYSSMRP
jgi:putative transposase